MPQPFAFGLNWKEYSRNTLTEESAHEAVVSLKNLLGAYTLDGKSFLDIGCGSGLFSIAAKMMGTRKVLGIDISPDSAACATENTKKLLGQDPGLIFEEGSVLDENKMTPMGLFDVVYAWGSLHHTGHMWRAIKISSAHVASGGIFVLAIYNRHITSPVWRGIKWLYNISHPLFRKLMIGFFFALIYLAKWAVTRKNPLKKNRGMNFYYDVVDWVGGYPYEYASAEEISKFVEGLGFTLERIIPAEVPTGNNQFVFKKTL